MEASALDRENHVHTPPGEFARPGSTRHVAYEKLVFHAISQTLAKVLYSLGHEPTETEGGIVVTGFLKRVQSLLQGSPTYNRMLIHVEPGSFAGVDRSDNGRFGFFVPA